MRNRYIPPPETPDELAWRRAYEEDFARTDFMAIVELAIVLLLVVALFAVLAHCVFGV